MSQSVSVVIPTYNSARLLGEAVASVRGQHWPDLEIIIVDDGSTDDTETVLKSLASDDVRWVRQANAGAASARNRGIEEAKGEWIAFLDVDDVWLPNKLRLQFEEIEKRPNVAFSYTDVTLRRDTGDQSHLECGDASKPLLFQLLGGNLFAAPTVLVRRDRLAEIGLFDERLRTGEDWDMWMRLASHFEHVRVALPLARISARDGTRFPLETLEKCTLQVLERLFSCSRIKHEWSKVASSKRLIYAWHYSVLAKSYLEHRRLTDFLRLAARAVTAHPAGINYLLSGKREAMEQRVFS